MDTMVYSETRADGSRASVTQGAAGRVIFRLDSGARSVRLVVRFDEHGSAIPLVTGDVACSESAAVDLLAGYRWFGLDWLLDALADALDASTT